MIDVVIGKDDFSAELAKRLNSRLIAITTRKFPENEIKPKLMLESKKEIEGKTTLIVTRCDRLRPDPNRYLIETYLIINRVGELGAADIKLFSPYLPYSRQDDSFSLGEANSLCSVGRLLSSSSLSEVYTFNSHRYGRKPGLKNYFSGLTVHDIPVSGVFASYLKNKKLENPIVIGIIDPEDDSSEMYRELAKGIGCDYDFYMGIRDHSTDKKEITPGKMNLFNRDVILHDDMTVTGDTIANWYDLVIKQKPNKVFVALAHLITKDVGRRLHNFVKEVITTDSLGPESSELYTELSLIPTISEYIKSQE